MGIRIVYRMKELIADRWWRIIAIVAGYSVVLRWSMVIWLVRPCSQNDLMYARCTSFVSPEDDRAWYFLTGEMIANGYFFKNPWIFSATGELVDTAWHPPAFPLMLALWSVLGINTIVSQLFMLSVVGAGTVVAIAVLARRLGGDAAGICAALLAMAHPLLWINDVTLMSESLYQLVVVILMIAAYRYVEDHRNSRAVLVGILIGVAALVRGEALLFGPLMFAPLVYCKIRKNTREQLKQKLRHLALSGIAAVAVIAPWIGYVNSVYDKPVMIISATGRLLLFSSCDSSWRGDDIGMFAHCFYELELQDEFRTAFPEAEVKDTLEHTIHNEIYDRTRYDASRVDSFYRKHALEYIGDNLSRYPIVMLARVARIFGVYPRNHADVTACCGHWSPAGMVGHFAYWMLMIPTAVGIWVLRRNGKRLTPLLAMWPVVAVTTSLTLVQLRFRVPVDIAMIVLSSIGCKSIAIGYKNIVIGCKNIVIRLWKQRETACRSNDQ